jgi:glycosyltransferase involved in cell wall biosynthesis
MKMTPEPPRVLLVSQPTIGGAALQVWQLATGQDRERFQLGVASPESGWLRERVLSTGGIHDTIEFSRDVHLLRDLKAFVALLALVRDRRPDVLHLHASKAGFLGRLVGLACRVPVVIYTPHGFSSSRSTTMISRLYLWLERVSGLFMDHMICVSEAERRFALEHRLARPEKVVLIRNGVELARAPEEGKGELRAILGVGDDCRIVAMVSRLRGPKRPEDLIRAAKILADRPETQSVRFVFIGGGPLERRLRQLAVDLGVEGRVAFLGDRTDVPRLLADVDISVLASASEGMPYALLEGMAAGKPVVGSRVPGIQELIREGETGYCYALGDALELADIVSRLLEDEPLRRRLGEEGRRRAVIDFPSERMIQETQALYTALLGPKPKRVPAT